jgi:hypothetical protein
VVWDQAFAGAIWRTAKCTYRHPARARVTSIAVPVRFEGIGEDR